MSGLLRTYTARLWPVGEGGADELWSHHCAVQAGKAALTDLLLTLRAGIAPKHLAETSGGLGAKALAAWWIVPESGPLPPGTPLVASDQRTSRFVAHLAGAGIAPAQDWASEAEDVLRAPCHDEARWVDRRQAWIDLAAALDLDMDNSDPLCDVIGRLLLGRLDQPDIRDTAARLSGTDSEVQTSQRAAMGWLSSRLGTGPKANWIRLIPLYETLASVPFAGGPTSAYVTRLCAVAGATSGEGLLALAKVTGRKSSGRLRLESLAAAGDAYLSATQAVETGQVFKEQARQYKLNKVDAGNRPWADLAQRRVEDAAGIRYVGHSHGWAEMLVDAAGAVAAQTTSTLNRLREQVAWAEQAAKLAEAIPTDERRTLDDYCDKRSAALDQGERYRLRRRALKAAPQVCRAWAKATSAEGRRAVLAELQAGDDPFGDPALYRWLADRDDWPALLRALPDYAEQLRLTGRLQHGRLPSLRHPDPLAHPRWVGFGQDAWTLNRGTTSDTWRLGLGHGAITVRVHSGRMDRDFPDPQPGSQPVVRADRLGRAAAAVRATDLVDASFGQDSYLSLRLSTAQRQSPGTGPPPSWIANLALHLGGTGPGQRWAASWGWTGPSRKSPPYQLPDSTYRPAGYRVLGVDLGHRQLAAWAVVGTETADSVDHWSVPTEPEDQWRCAPDGRRWRRLGPDGPAPWALLETFGKRPAPRGRAPTWPERLIAARIIRTAGIAPPQGEPGCLDLGRDVLRAVTKRVKALNHLGTVACSLNSDTTDLAVPTLAQQLHKLGDNASFLTPEEREQADRTRSARRLCANSAARRSAAETATADYAHQAVELRACLRATRRLLFGGPINDDLAKQLGVKPGRVGRLPGLKIGLTPERADLLNRFYQLIKSYWSRTTPTGPAHDVRTERFAAKLLTLRGGLRNDLSKQIASGIVAAALEHGCHAIAIEDLDKYGPDQGRGRGENRLLARWAHQGVRRYIEELAELHGLFVRAVNPRYSSHEDCRTGGHGLRVARTDAAARSTDPWPGRIDRAQKAIKRGDAGPYQRALVKAWDAGNELLPIRGGKLFLPDREDSVRDVDENAAGVIAYRAMQAKRRASHSPDKVIRTGNGSNTTEARF